MTNIRTTDSPARRAAKSARLEARMTEDQKELFERAAALTGRSLTEFIVSSVEEVAARTIREHETMRLSVRDSKAFVATLLKSPAPGERLRKAARRYRRAVET